MEPVRLDVFANDRLIDTVRADRFREDLVGHGNGCHGFYIDLDRRGLRGDETIRVKVSNRTIEIDNSGLRLDQYEVHATTP